MARTGSSARKRVWKIVVVAVMVSVAAIGSLIYWKRCEIALWIMQGSKDAQEIAILRIQGKAEPIIKTELTMTLFQKIFSALTGRRNEKERQTDALNDVRKFNELSFENHWLYFNVAHNLDSLYGFKLHGFDFVLVWNRENADEVLAEFNINFLTRKLARMLVNQNSSYFTDLKLYIEKKAKEN